MSKNFFSWKLLRKLLRINILLFELGGCCLLKLSSLESIIQSTFIYLALHNNQLVSKVLHRNTSVYIKAIKEKYLKASCKTQRNDSNLNVGRFFFSSCPVSTSCASPRTTPMRSCTRCWSWPSVRAARASACSDSSGRRALAKGYGRRGSERCKPSSLFSRRPSVAKNLPDSE